MGDQRELTMGIRFELAKAVSQLSSIVDAIGEIRGGFQTAEQAADAFGTRAAHSVGAMAGGLGEASDAAEDVAGSLEGVTDAGEGVQGAFREAGESAEEFESAVAEAGTEVAKEAGSMSDAIRTGIRAAYKDAEKRVKAFGTKVKSGASQVKNAVLHPIRAVKSGMSDMLEAVTDRLPLNTVIIQPVKRFYGALAVQVVENIGDFGRTFAHDVHELTRKILALVVGNDSVIYGIRHKRFEHGVGAVERFDCVVVYLVLHIVMQFQFVEQQITRPDYV